MMGSRPATRSCSTRRSILARVAKCRSGLPPEPNPLRGLPGAAGHSFNKRLEYAGISAPLAPFTRETAIQDAWNTCDPHRVALGYTIDSKWRSRAEIFEGRENITAFLTRSGSASSIIA